MLLLLFLVIKMVEFCTAAERGLLKGLFDHAEIHCLEKLNLATKLISFLHSGGMGGGGGGREDLALRKIKTTTDKLQVLDEKNDSLS